MPPKQPVGGRTTRQRAVATENDENSNSTRLTRAKAASLGVDELALPSKVLQTKKAAGSANAAAGPRKRAALGDLSNVTKTDGLDGKKAGGKVGLVSKAAQPSGVQKKTAVPRPALAVKEGNKKVEKRSGSGSNTIGVQKRKVSAAASTATIKEEEFPDESEPSRKKVHTTEVEKKKTVAVKKETILAKASQEEESDAEVGEEAEETVPFEYPEGVQDLDTEDMQDPLMVAEYTNEIFEYLRDLESRSLPNPAYMNHQDDLEWKTRGILIDWLIEVHTRFHLLPETLFLAINIIDRFLSAKVVQLDRLQLVGVAAMFIASKYEEVLSPHVANFRHVADDGFTEDEILAAERTILGVLNYDLSYPNPMNFLRRISKADNYDIQCRTIGKYLMEISLLDHRFMAYRPSHVAAAAMYLARLIFERGEWDATIAWYAGFAEEDVEPVVELMVDYLSRPVTHEAFFKKYASKKFLKASLITRNWARKNRAIYNIPDPELSLDQLS